MKKKENKTFDNILICLDGENEKQKKHSQCILCISIVFYLQFM